MINDIGLEITEKDLLINDNDYLSEIKNYYLKIGKLERFKEIYSMGEIFEKISDFFNNMLDEEIIKIKEFTVSFFIDYKGHKIHTSVPSEFLILDKTRKHNVEIIAQCLLDKLSSIYKENMKVGDKVFLNIEYNCL